MTTTTTIAAITHFGTDDEDEDGDDWYGLAQCAPLRQAPHLSKAEAVFDGESVIVAGLLPLISVFGVGVCVVATSRSLLVLHLLPLRLDLRRRVESATYITSDRFDLIQPWS
ncbi:hypothetical protein CRG98_017687 [Punica granatum]|uniref:Uncharacterized protein n=1 Tax=Punica granatum TaxID=22663 RepID=A0A2I0K075_PUNGR|nr:hypothetical protein CRG98_017687 [Punica granatum]